MQQRIATVRRKGEERKRPRVFCEEWGKPIIASQRGWQNWWKPPEEISSVNRADNRPMNSRPSIRTSSSRPGAAREIGYLWKKSFAIGGWESNLRSPGGARVLHPR